MFKRNQLLHALMTAVVVVVVGSLQACSKAPTDPYEYDGPEFDTVPSVHTESKDAREPDCIYIAGQWFCDDLRHTSPERPTSSSGE